MQKQLLSMLCLAGLSATAQLTAIPDPAFEQRLIDLNIDSDGVVNGQMATIDAVGITSLVIVSPNPSPGQYITDLTGLEAFIDIESLTVNVTMIEELNVSSLVNLKYLNCVDNMLSSLDVSNNPVLEELIIFMGGDVLPMNSISEIDLSNNPLIHTLTAYAIDYINLQNGNNNSNMNINISAGLFGMDPEYIHGHTCIEIDDEDAAQSNQLPYSEWEITHENQSYALVGSCELGNGSFISNSSISVYPNPASDMLYFNTSDGMPVDKIIMFDATGRVVKEVTKVSSAGVSVAGLAKGMYVLQISSNNTAYTQKIIVK